MTKAVGTSLISGGVAQSDAMRLKDGHFSEGKVGEKGLEVAIRHKKAPLSSAGSARQGKERRERSVTL